jgi:hypothetical protein
MEGGVMGAFGILTHEEEVAALSGPRRYLTSEYLPFIAPGLDDKAHPNQILSRLGAQDGQNCVLVVGVAGIGRTRTCFEVGTRAAADNWAVLHVVPGEPLVTMEQVADAIQNAGDRVLVIIDDLNENPGIDLTAWRHRLIPTARSRGQHVALLASARPGWQIMAEEMLRPLFTTVWLAHQPLHSVRIQDQLIDSLAPRALAILGVDRLRELCGLRPMIAMLIAQEAEAQAARGARDSALLGVRPAELLGWLDRWMWEDRLILQSTVGLVAEPALQALAGMLAAAPRDKPDMVACGAAVLGDAEHAERLLGIFRFMGWIVPVPGGLAAVHEIVRGQLLERVLVRPVRTRTELPGTATQQSPRKPHDGDGPSPAFDRPTDERADTGKLTPVFKAAGSAYRGHAFISYVREDSGKVDVLQNTLQAAGIPVWRDIAGLWPGDDWREKIRDAITHNALVFIACFSTHSVGRNKSYQYEELLLAIEQLRQRRPGDPWLIPVRFDDCDVPDVDLGAGKTLASIHRADLFGANRELTARRLVEAIQRFIG